jgi:hypothetical protein
MEREVEDAVREGRTVAPPAARVRVGPTYTSEDKPEKSKSVPRRKL